MIIITKLLEFRGFARRFFQRFHFILAPIFKFIVSYFAFHTINNTLAYDARLSRPVIELGLAAVSTFLPMAIMILFAALLSIAQVYSVSPILAALVVVIFAVLYCFIVRFSGKYGYAIIGMPILTIFNIPYLIPLLLGMVATPIAVFPTACGVIVYYVFKVIQEAALRQDITSLDATLALYIDVVDSLFTHKEMFFTIAIFSVVIIVMYFVRKLHFEFVFELTIVLGAVLLIFGFLLVNLQFGIGPDILDVLLGTLYSTLLVFAAQFFRMVLDYTSVERVQFEDDDYYYYVKAVPKIDMTLPEKSVTNFSEWEDEKTQEKAPKKVRKSLLSMDFLKKKKEQEELAEDDFENEDWTEPQEMQTPERTLPEEFDDDDDAALYEFERRRYEEDIQEDTQEDGTPLE